MMKLGKKEGEVKNKKKEKNFIFLKLNPIENKQ